MNANTQAKVTTHVLDTSLGRPAAGLLIEVYRLADDGSRALLSRSVTNADGRCDGPVIGPHEIAAGTYEFLFHAGAYLDRVHGPASGPRFLDVVPIRFGIADPTQHYHVPLLLSPHGYTTYRGS